CARSRNFWSGPFDSW
nr:immunoglobulin heavy chain junction region [Macaca mulatta]MOY22545.1 immunoglobulin heavy chain junction region [Macaca mulatta]MOY22567.1 immunoglobulin heavy chain junction region [Macaca mulatta]MOY23476.1 immunoglobulin heavy chain junction region [Macaca mulatta]MOY23798.1 immunoglobulin heavy chain junction region [Macaca mulatta]